MRRGRFISLAARLLLFALLLGAPGLNPLLAQDRSVGSAAMDDRQAAGLGQRVYVAVCATCHGLRGNGEGPEALEFAQRPTNFSKGTYKLRSTTGDIPEPGDLERTIRVGMSGTEMVAFKNVLSDRSIQAVAQYLRTFSPELSDPDAAPDADDRVAVPAQRPFARSAETIEAGQELWAENECADCHGELGEGTTDEEDDWGFRVDMVPFQAGYYKSGPTDQDLYRTIATGMKGTTMPGFLDDASEEELWKMVDYIRSLAEERSSGLFGMGNWPLIGPVYRYLFHARPSGFDYSNY